MLRNTVLSLTATIAATIAAVTLVPQATNADYVTTYTYKYFGGDPDYTNVNIYSDYGRCFTFACTNDRSSSATWGEFPQLFGMDVYVWFFTDANCQGSHRVWPGRDMEGKFPNNFAVDGIDKAVSSFMVSHTVDVWNGHAVSCPDKEQPNKEARLALVLSANTTANATATP